MAKTVSWFFVAVFVGLALVFAIAYADPLKIGKGSHSAQDEPMIATSPMPR